MASIYYYLDTRKKLKTDNYLLKLAIRHAGKCVYSSLDIRLPLGAWDKAKEKIIKAPHATEQNIYLSELKTQANTKLLELTKLGKLGRMTAKELRTEIEKYLLPSEEEEDKPTDLILPFFERCIELKRAPQTKEVYKSTIDKIRGFDTNADGLTFGEIKKDWLQRFDLHLSQTLKTNSISIHMRNLRAVFNEAIDNEITTNYPFRKFKIRSEETAKRSLDVEELRTLFCCEVEPHVEKYRDIFKLSFFLIGISPVDLLHLTEINRGRISYHRAKTGKLYDIKVENEALAIIEKYRGNKYMLSILETYGNYKDFTKKVNNALKNIGEVTIGKQGKKTYKPLFPCLTLYWARHTWATIAHQIGISKDIISLALGHSFGVDTTDIYIRYDKKKVDEANRRVIDFVLYNE